jgi:hypothetical protein
MWNQIDPYVDEIAEMLAEMLENFPYMGVAKSKLRAVLS